MKVFVMTKARVFEPEEYVGVKATRKLAEKELRRQFPYMRPNSGKDGNFVQGKTADDLVLLFIHEEEV